MEEITKTLVEGTMTVLIAVLAEAARRFAIYIKEKGVLKALNKHKDLANLAVAMTEQIYVDLKGEEKKNKAIEVFLEVLGKKGIKLSDTEINMYIESAVKAMNDAAKTALDETNQNK